MEERGVGCRITQKENCDPAFKEPHEIPFKQHSKSFFDTLASWGKLKSFRRTISASVPRSEIHSQLCGSSKMISIESTSNKEVKKTEDSSVNRESSFLTGQLSRKQSLKCSFTYSLTPKPSWRDKTKKKNFKDYKKNFSSEEPEITFGSWLKELNDLQNLVEQLLLEIPRKNKRVGRFYYTNCFTGADIVLCLVNKYSKKEDTKNQELQAFHLCQRLLRNSFIRSCTQEGPEFAFSPKVYYVFSCELQSIIPSNSTKALKKVRGYLRLQVILDSKHLVRIYPSNVLVRSIVEELEVELRKDLPNAKIKSLHRTYGIPISLSLPAFQTLVQDDILILESK